MVEQHSSCEHLLGSLSEYVDGELGKELCAEIEKHLADCTNCQVVVNTLRKTIELYRAANSFDKVPESVVQRLYMRLDIEDFRTH